MSRLLVLVVATVACSSKPNAVHPSGAAIAPLSLAKDQHMVDIPAGQYISGSTPEERTAAYDDYLETAGHDTAREKKWFEGESDRSVSVLEGFRIDLMPVTQVEYAEFVTAKLAPPPSIDQAAWQAQGFVQDYTVVERFNWRDGYPPVGREDHPVVLVTWQEAESYCEWRGKLSGGDRRLPTEPEFEKAARGDSGLAYPWGNIFEAEKLNSAVKGPRDTTPVGQFVEGKSPYGVLDAAGNVFQWTSTKFKDGHMTVKGSAWEDFGGVGRGASRHGRPVTARHVIVGFRCAAPG
ncbi:MAG TPA: SUMF1/EgtB/PvdO family nonheme iron enzyme [Kofleriaceae bacterium]